MILKHLQLHLNYLVEETVFLGTGLRFHQCLNHFPYRERYIVSSRPPVQGEPLAIQKEKNGALGEPVTAPRPGWLEAGCFKRVK